MPSSQRWASAYYFLYFAAGAAFWPFQVLYYQSRGLSGSEIGILSAVSTLISLWASPVLTGLADAGRHHRAVFVATGLATAVSTVLIAQTGRPLFLLVFVSTFAMFSAGLIPLMDSSVVAMLGERSDRYGRIRLWGSIGWGLTAPLAGAFIQAHGLPWAYWMGAVGLILSLVASRGVPFARQEQHESYWKGARRLLSNRQWWLFLFVALVAGMGSAAYNNYLFAYLESLGASKTFMGIAQTAATVSELPFFFFAGSLLKRFRARGLLIMALAAMGLKCMLYWIVRTPWGVLPIQLMNGLSFSLLWSAGVSFARESAPAGLGATAQGLFGAVLFGFGGAAGGFLGGVLLGSIGASSMYGVFALITLAGLAVFLLGERLFGGRHVGDRRTGARPSSPSGGVKER